jgi:glycosyltransferase involved in cell wall biosynthesis
MKILVIVVFLVPRDIYATNYSHNGANVIRLPGRVRYLFVNMIRLAKITIQNRVDVIHVFTGSSTILGAFCLALGRIMMIQSVLSIFGREDVSFSTQLAPRIFACSCSLAHNITTNSFATRSLLPPRFQQKTKVLLGGADIQATENTNKASNERIILFVGRLVRRKGLDDLLEAFAILKNELPPPKPKLIIVGEGPERGSLKEKAESLGLTNDVEFKGYLTGRDLQQEYERCTIFVLPSKFVQTDVANEGLGLSLIEASMYGKPLVATNHGGISEIVKNGVNGLLVPEADPTRLSQALRKLLINPRLASEMGSNALRIARNELSWEVATKRLLDSYMK